MGYVEAAPFALRDMGSEFPVAFEKYGTFSGKGTSSYKYKISNRAGLAKAMGAGLFPPSATLEKEPGFKRWKRAHPGKVEPWDHVNTGDSERDFFAWTQAKDVGPGTKLFFTAEALAEAGHFRQALKAYYAIVVLFPGEPCWSADHSFVWYLGPAALGKIETLTKHHPELGWRLKGAVCTVANANDVNLDNDVVTVHPGTWVRRLGQDTPRPEKSVLHERGLGKVRVVQFDDRSWQLQVEGKPYFVRGISYSPTVVGTHISEVGMNTWMHNDLDDNDVVDTAFESWVDKNKNNQRDPQELTIGDFQLMKDMGANTIRIYRNSPGLDYNPSEFNKDLLREMNATYGISAIMGDFLGAYTVGSGADWDAGTDYTDPVQLDNMRQSITAYVKDHRDEPYVLMWVLGNENLMPSEFDGVNATRTNAAQNPQAYLAFVNEIVELIHRLDPDHPVAVGNFNLANLSEHSLHAPAVDIFGANVYSGSDGFGRLWKNVQEEFDRPVLITEFGCDAFDSRKNREEEDQQARYHEGVWKDIELNASGRGEEGNSIGAIVFSFLDEWWKSPHGSWDVHDAGQDSPMAFPDGWASEEWFGLFSQGDGKSSPLLRQPRKAYFLYRDKLWKITR